MVLWNNYKIRVPFLSAKAFHLRKVERTTWMSIFVSSWNGETNWTSHQNDALQYLMNMGTSRHWTGGFFIASFDFQRALLTVSVSASLVYISWVLKVWLTKSFQYPWILHKLSYTQKDTHFVNKHYLSCSIRMGFQHLQRLTVLFVKKRR